MTFYQLRVFAWQSWDKTISLDQSLASHIQATY